MHKQENRFVKQCLDDRDASTSTMHRGQPNAANAKKTKTAQYRAVYKTINFFELPSFCAVFYYDKQGVDNNIIIISMSYQNAVECNINIYNK